MTDEERIGQQIMSWTDENIANIDDIVCENWRMTVKFIADQVNINREIVWKISWGHPQGVCQNGFKRAHWRTNTKDGWTEHRSVGTAKQHFGSNNHS